MIGAQRMRIDVDRRGYCFSYVSIWLAICFEIFVDISKDPAGIKIPYFQQERLC